jgi:hypothetical protein
MPSQVSQEQHSGFFSAILSVQNLLCIFDRASAVAPRCTACNFRALEPCGVVSLEEGSVSAALCLLGNLGAFLSPSLLKGLLKKTD